MNYQQIQAYEEACSAIQQWGILPLSSFVPGHPSLEAITAAEAWHTGEDTDPWLWRDRFAEEGAAAYGRFLGGKPVLISRELFPLVKCLLSPAKSVEERYRAGTLARATVRVYEVIAEQAGVDVKELRKLADLRRAEDKREFERALLDLQSTADIVISGVAGGRLNAQGNKSGWNSACYMLAAHWMELHHLEALTLTPREARTQLTARLEPSWTTEAFSIFKRIDAQLQAG